MNFAWKFMLPMALLNLVVAGLWHFMGPGAARWVVCTTLLAGLYVSLARGLAQSGHIAKRTYRYAD